MNHHLLCLGWAGFVSIVGKKRELAKEIEKLFGESQKRDFLAAWEKSVSSKKD